MNSNFAMLGRPEAYNGYMDNPYGGMPDYSGYYMQRYPNRPAPGPQVTNYAALGCYNQNVNGWTGVPLISTAASANRRPRKFPPTPASPSSPPYEDPNLSRMAMHAHGAPLILAGRYRPPNRTKPLPVAPKPASPKPENGEEERTGADTCLPRIIKPRKRRKKDRKPPTAPQVLPMSNNPAPLQSPTLAPEPPQPDTSGTCYCRLCDPSRRIWAFPLRRSYSDTDSSESGTADFGAIGSNRSWLSNGGSATDWPIRNGSFSDSSDSGCADVVAGHFQRTNSTNSCDSGCSSVLNDFGIDIDFSTAESLLTESINEISKKLMETCDLRGGSGSAAASDSSSLTSMFGDESLVFNFDNLRGDCDWQSNQLTFGSGSGSGTGIR